MVTFKIVTSAAFVLSLLGLSHGGYIITTSRKWTHGTEAQICVQHTDGSFTSSDELNVAINPLSRDPNIGHPQLSINLPQGESNVCQSLPVPPTENRKVEMSIQGSLSGFIVEEAENVSIARSHGSTYVQTDKYRYLPGQNVQFRILSVDGPRNRLRTDPYKEIYIEDPSGTRIQQWLNVANPGLVHLSFNLADEPEEGSYNVYVEESNGRRSNTNFLVEEYTLPRYEVTIEPVGIVLGSDKNVTLKLCAKYTFGQNVEGVASLNVIVGSYRTYANITQEKPISGCEEFTFDTKDLRFEDNNCHIRVSSIKAEAKVIESGTDNELSGNNGNIRVYRRVINYDDRSPQFSKKKHLPVFYSIKATYNDGSPATNEPMSVCSYYNRNNICKDITTDREGNINFVMPNTVSGNVKVKSKKHLTLYLNWNNVMEESTYTKYLYSSDAFTDAHNASISIYTDEEIQCKSGQSITATFPLIYIVEDATPDEVVEVNVQVVSRGIIQHTSKQQVPLIKTPLPFDRFPYIFKEQNIPSSLVIGSYDLTVQLPTTVSPKVQVVVWFRRKGVVIADSKSLDVTPCLDHGVGMSWSVEKAEPGSTAELTLSGEKGALCSYDVVDKSVVLLSNPNDPLTVENIINMVNSYEARRWDGSDQVDLEYCLKKYNKTLDVPLPKEEEEEERLGLPPPPLPLAPLSRKRRSTFLRGHTELEAADMFHRAGLFVFSNLDLESQNCDRMIYQALKDKIANSQITEPEISNKVGIAHRPMSSPQAAAFGAPAPMAEAGFAADFDGESFPESPEEPRERNYFPETWLFNLVELPQTGKSTESLTLPDTITEWVGKAVCVHPDKGIGISPRVSVVTFTSFFIDLTLPPSVKRHEVFPLKISIFNYEKHELPIEVIVDKDTGVTFDINGEKGVRLMCIPPNSQRTETIKIKATTIGDLEIGVNAAVAASNKCGPQNPTYKSDRIVRSLPVAAEGLVRERVNSEYICSEDTAGKIMSKIEAPANIVQDSPRAWVNFIGDLIPFENIGSVLDLPHGCGEQNLARFAPNIFVAQYLDSTAGESGELRDQAIRHMRTGYQRQLTFKRDSGSFSTFGNYDDSGSTWLTAFAVKSFSQAKPYITVDEKLMREAIKWLKERQMPDGCFEARGKVINKRMLGGLQGKTSLLTAYVLIALLEAEGKKDAATVTSAIQCVTSDVMPDPINEPYDAALKAYSLILAGDLKGKEILDSLLSAAIDDGKSMRWSIPGGNNRALEVETAGYALLAMLQSDNAQAYMPSARKVVRWLTSQKNSRGGFVSTQDTVVALQAVSAFETSRPPGPQNLNIGAAIGGQPSKQIIIDSTNKRLQQTEQIDSVPADLQFELGGTGCALIQSVLRYNVLAEDKNAAFALSLDVTPAKGECGTRNMKICVSYTLSDEKSNMAVIEINLLTGYMADRPTLVQAVGESLSVKRYEYENGKVNFYIDEATAKPICVSFKVLREIEVSNLQEAHVKAYDYYQPEFTTEQKYNFDLSSCNVP